MERNGFFDRIIYRKVPAGEFVDSQGKKCRRYKKVRRFKLLRSEHADDILLRVLLTLIGLAIAAFVLSEMTNPNKGPDMFEGKETSY